MGKAIGMLEYLTVSTGVQAADMILKTAKVSIIEAKTVCPGKYIVIFSGDLSSVNASIEASKKAHAENLIESFVLGNPHEDILSAIYGATEIKNKQALGIVETFSAASIIVAADEAAKTSQVELIEIRIARGMSGKSYLMLTGDVGAVEAAIKKATEVVGKSGMLLDCCVIANPDKELWDTIL